MGVNTRINLPENVRAWDVMSVIGAAAGCPKRRNDFQCKTGWAAQVDNIEMENCEGGLTSVGMARITIRQKTIDGQDGHFVLYFFEPEMGGRLMIPPSTGFWIAVGKRLITFFGGRLDYNDCDEVEWDEIVEAKSDAYNRGGSADDWYNRQQRILDIQLITEEEWKMCGQLST